MAIRYFNTSEKDWDGDPYMIKEHTVYSECGKYAATVVVIPLAGKKKDGEEAGLSFLPMGVRIEHIAGRKQIGEYILPGGTYFIKRKDQMVSETAPWTFQRQGTGFVPGAYGRPALNKPVKHPDDYTRHIDDHKSAAFLKALQERAFERYEAYRAAKRAA
jgi:hypothetical protein